MQQLKFATSDTVRLAGGKRANEDSVERSAPGGATIVYRLVDNPAKLSDDEWQRVVAVFVQGPTWQFKGWKMCQGDPTLLFQHMCAFHLKYDETPLDPNVAKWAVTVLSLSRNNAHEHRPALLRFWTELDKFVKAHPRLRDRVRRP